MDNIFVIINKDCEILRNHNYQNKPRIFLSRKRAINYLEKYHKDDECYIAEYCVKYVY